MSDARNGDDEQRKRVLREHMALRSMVADVTLAWADLENTLVMFLAAIMGGDTFKGLASAIYFAPGNLETRLAIVDRAFRELLFDNPVEDHLGSTWNTLMNALGRLKVTRNKVAHGQIVTIALGTRQHVKLTAPIFDFQRSREIRRQNQLIGLSSHDIQNSVDAVRRAGRKIRTFSEKVVPLVRSGDTSTLRKIILQLDNDPLS